MAADVAFWRDGNVIHLVCEEMTMIKNEIIARNPLINLGYDNEYILNDGALGAVLAHAGVGKTALLVQVALHAMLHERPVLHVSLNDAVSKVDVWYRELFYDIAGKYDSAEIRDLREQALVYRFIMTIQVEGFSVAKFEERLTDLMQQNIFKPHTVIIDGLKFDDSGRGPLLELKEMAARYAMRIWFTVHTHRHEPPQQDGIPMSFRHVADLFDVLVELIAEGQQIDIKPLKGQSAEAKKDSIRIDPTTMLIKG